MTSLPIPHCSKTACFIANKPPRKRSKPFSPRATQSFRKTHDLNELGLQCAQVEPSLEPLCRRVAQLTAYAWIFRYPGQPGEPTMDEARSALSLVRELLHHIEDRLV